MALPLGETQSLWVAGEGRKGAVLTRSQHSCKAGGESESILLAPLLPTKFQNGGPPAELRVSAVPALDHLLCSVAHLST